MSGRRPGGQNGCSRPARVGRIGVGGFHARTDADEAIAPIPRAFELGAVSSAEAPFPGGASSWRTLTRSGGGQ